MTPLKDTFSPQNEDVVYGAPNRPTDYSSSSSYYKPDESDGIDRQIQASIQSGRKNSNVYSADDMDESSKIDDTTHNSSKTSTSSSSSSSSDSDSDSDSSSSSSESDTSQRSQKLVDENEREQPQTQPTPVENLIDEDTTEEIKSHLVSANQVNIAQNILLSEPEAPILKEDEKQFKLLIEKRRRMQESLRQVEMKNQEKAKSKQIKKNPRTTIDVKRDRLRAVAPTIAPSPSKRKSTQPKKIVSIESQRIYSETANVASGSRNTIIAEQLRTEAAGDNPIADAPETSMEEESIEAIKTHMAKAVCDEMSASKKSLPTSPQRLVDMLMEKNKKLEASRPKIHKAEVIEALPLLRTTRSRTRNQRPIIAPVKNIITQPKGPNHPALKPANSNAQMQRRSKENKPNVNTSSGASNQKEKTVPKAADPPKVQQEDVRKFEPEYNFETPAKNKLARQKIRDLFGDCTDIETPMKSPPKVISTPAVRSPAPKTANQSTKSAAADSSMMSDSSDETDESDSDDERPNEMTLSIDESDKKRFICIRENALAISKSMMKPTIIGTKRVYLPDNVQITLEPTDVMELYTQDIDSVAKMQKNREGTRRSKENKIETNIEAVHSTDSDSMFGKPLQTSTPSPAKAVTPKFNIKHKPAAIL